VHQDIAARFLPALSQQMAQSGVTLHGDEMALATLKAGPANVVAVKAEEYDDEFLSLDLNVKIVTIWMMPSPTSASMVPSIPMRS
jgi:glutamate-5-semialdehyde dehydrogenase